MQSGTEPTRISKKDYDFHKSFGSVTPIAFPDSIITDTSDVMHNQNEVDTSFTPPVEAMPDGCTNEATTSIATVLTGGTIIYRPDTLEAETHANANGGLDLRTSLSAGVKLNMITGFFNIQRHGNLDWFDSFALAQISGATESRAISWGTPWFPSWEEAFNSRQGLMPMPTDIEIATAKKEAGTFGSVHKVKHNVMRLFGSTVPFISWHNSELANRTTINNTLVYWNKSWQGNYGGDRGWVYLEREVINTVMSINGTVAFTATRGVLPPITTITAPLVQWILSNLAALQRYLY